MSTIIHEFPGITTDTYSGFSFRYKKMRYDLQGSINKPFDSLPKDDKALIKYFTKRLIKDNKDRWDWYDFDDKAEKKTLKSLSKIATSIKRTDGNCLISFFVETTLERGKDIKTTIEENCLTPEIKDSPVNIDYDADLHKVGFIKGLVDKNHDCVFSIEHKTREKDPYFQCGSCGGSGKVMCPNCEGSGREQYEAGYYASGVEKIKTGACSVCGGSGKIDCPDCGGTGKVEIFAPEYSVVKSVEENFGRRLKCYITLPGDKNMAYTFSNQSTLGTLKYVNKVEESGVLAFCKKNVYTIDTDNREKIRKELEVAGFGHIYEEIERKLGEVSTKPNKDGIDIVSRREAHYVFPMSIIEFSYGSDNGAFIYHEAGDKTYIYLAGLETLSSIKRFFLRISALFKKN